MEAPRLGGEVFHRASQGPLEVLGAYGPGVQVRIKLPHGAEGEGLQLLPGRSGEAPEDPKPVEPLGGGGFGVGLRRLGQALGGAGELQEEGFYRGLEVRLEALA
ncbi:hypothetical protein GCM10007092_15660 [Thermus composti]|nr:hypothetical protein GCM10007092_15660 [Thermus composti]